MLNKRKRLSFLLFVILIYTIFIICGMNCVLNKNDDRVMMELLSGAFTGEPDAHVFFIKYPFAYLIKMLYAFLPGFHWYGIMLLGSHMLALFTILYRITESSDSMQNMLVSSSLIVFIYSFFWMGRISNTSFTYAAAALGTAAVFYLATGKMNFYKYVYVILLLVLTFCWREAVFLMVAPVAFVIVLFSVWSEKNNIRELVIAITVLCVLLSCIKVIHKNAYSGKEWETYREYDSYRAEIYDYIKFPDYEDNVELYQTNHISESEYKALKKWNVAIVGEKCIPIYKAIYDDQMEKNRYTFSSILDAVRLVFLKFMSKECRAYNLGACIVWGIGCAVCICKKNKKDILLNILLTGVYISLYFYLGIKGRIMERVMAPMYLLLFTLGLIQIYRNRDFVKKNLNYFIVINIAILLLGIFVGEWKSCREKNLSQWRVNKDYDKMVSYCNENSENYYMIETASIRTYTDNIHWIEEKPMENNYIMMGDWHAFSPMYYKKILSRFHTSDMREIALENENVYFIWKKGEQVDYLNQLWSPVEPDVENTGVIKGKYFKFYIRKYFNGEKERK